MLRQRTLKSLIKSSGVGLHTGQKVRMSLRPAPVDTGVVFRRVDLTPPVDIPARAELVGEARLASTLVKGDAKVYTVEHLMSALPSMIGTSGASRSTYRLSMPSPLSADIRCSTV
jgi:UDP-3-O-[3-hydroxymyristoyl] N-acetylglucosamine deacetylase